MVIKNYISFIGNFNLRADKQIKMDPIFPLWTYFSLCICLFQRCSALKVLFNLSYNIFSFKVSFADNIFLQYYIFFSQKTQSVGLLSYTFLRKTGQDHTIVPMVIFSFQSYKYSIVCPYLDIFTAFCYVDRFRHIWPLGRTNYLWFQGRLGGKLENNP